MLAVIAVTLTKIFSRDLASLRLSQPLFLVCGFLVILRAFLRLSQPLYYSKWSQFIDEAVNIKHNTNNVSTGKIPNNAVLFQQKEDIDDVKDSITEKQ